MFVYLLKSTSPPPPETVHIKDRHCSIRWISDESFNLLWISTSSPSGSPLPWVPQSQLSLHAPWRKDPEHVVRIVNPLAPLWHQYLLAACILSSLQPDIWQCHLKGTLYLRCDTPSWNEKILALKYHWWHVGLNNRAIKSISFIIKVLNALYVIIFNIYFAWIPLWPNTVYCKYSWLDVFF